MEVAADILCFETRTSNLTHVRGETFPAESTDSTWTP